MKRKNRGREKKEARKREREKEKRKRKERGKKEKRRRKKKGRNVSHSGSICGPGPKNKFEQMGIAKVSLGPGVLLFSPLLHLCFNSTFCKLRYWQQETLLEENTCQSLRRVQCIFQTQSEHFPTKVVYQNFDCKSYEINNNVSTCP